MLKFQRLWSGGFPAVLLILSLVILFAGCGGSPGTGTVGTVQTMSTDLSKNTGGLTSIEASKLAWPDAKKVFEDAVLWRLAPIPDRYSTSITLDPDWRRNDRSAAWFVWYADPAGENWFMISISGKSIAKRDIGTRGSVISMDASWPRESTAVSMKDAATAAAAQGANLDAVTWLEFNCDYKASDFRNKPCWVFECSETLDNGGALNYTIFVDAISGEVTGAVNDRGDKMTLPIDRQTLQQARAVDHQDDVLEFFSFISKGDPIWAVRQMAYQATPNEAISQQWLANFQSIKSLKVVSIDQANLEQWTEEWESFKVVLDVSTSKPPEKYGWENGRNTRWVSLIPEGGGAWKVAELSPNP